MSIVELREAFFSRLEEGRPNSDLFHSADLERVKDDAWLQKFLNHSEGDKNIALQTLIDSCLWRKEFGANDINKTNINLDYMKEGLFYPRGKDIDGCTILIFKTKKYVKTQKNFDELTRCLVYWFEHLSKVENCDRISIFFDMDDAGMSNLDVDFTKYIINLFKLYYPDFLNYIIMYEVPWILNAAIKIIKSLLPAKGVSKMKFVSKSDISTYVPLDQAQKSWGGQDDYIYSFDNTAPDNELSIKKVTFADPDSRTHITQEEVQDDNDENKIMKLCPRDVIVFKLDNNDIIGGFSITNISNSSITYKIKTTVPEKTKVNPNVGVLGVGKSESIKITLIIPSHGMNTVSNIKFLVVSTPISVDMLTSQDLTDLWKSKSLKISQQSRLRCSVPFLEFNKKGIMDSDIPPMESEREIHLLHQSILNLKSSHEILNGQLKNLKTIQLINVTLSVLLICLLVYFFFTIGNVPENYGEFCTGP